MPDDQTAPAQIRTERPQVMPGAHARPPGHAHHRAPRVQRQGEDESFGASRRRRVVLGHLLIVLGHLLVGLHPPPLLPGVLVSLLKFGLLVAL